jgi:alanine racemase
MARAWAEIDLPAIDRNVGRIKQSLPSRIRYVAVIKADAYGHGMPEVAARLLQAGVDCFAVANVAEAARLREVGHDGDILVLSPSLPEEHDRAVHLDLDLTLNSPEEARALAAAAARAGRRAKVHIKADTGMGRAGVWHAEAPALIDFASTPIFRRRARTMPSRPSRGASSSPCLTRCRSVNGLAS